MKNRKRSQEESYAETFKPAMVLGAPTLEDIENNFYLQAKKEGIDTQGNLVQYRTKGAHLSLDPELNDVYTLKTDDPTISPTVRQVTVDGKSEYSPCFVFEPVLGERGISVLLFREASAEEFHCNSYFLPTSNLEDLVVGQSADQLLRVELPENNIIKLKVTIKPSSTGETLYNTHETEVILENLSESDELKLKQELEFNTAREIAHIASQLLEIKPPQFGSFNQLMAPQVYELSINWGTVKRWVSGATALGTLTGAALTVTGIATGGAGWLVGGALTSGLSGITRGVLGTTTKTGVQFGIAYTCKLIENDVEQGGTIRQKITILK